jgi:dTDP-glucose pyrophosphorylase
MTDDVVPNESAEAMKQQRLLSATLPLTSTIQDAVRNLDRSGLQITLIVSEGCILLGTVTDGDIRRGLLRGFSLTSDVQSILNREPFVVPPELNPETVLHLMQANKLHQMPVVDGSRRVVGLHLWADLLAPAPRSNLVVVMAGGRGTRLLPHTENCPKPLLPVNGKPMLEHIVERAKGEGFSNFVFAIHHLGHMIESYFGDGSRLNVNITYLREDKPLGTAGALSLLQPRPSVPFVVTNGDVMTDVRYGEVLEFHDRHNATATMSVRQYEWQHPFGVVHTRGVDIVGFEEKPISRSHINAGVYVLNPDALDLLVPAEACDMPTLFARLQEERKRTIVYPMYEPWLDVGEPRDYNRANTSA